MVGLLAWKVVAWGWWLGSQILAWSKVLGAMAFLGRCVGVAACAIVGASGDAREGAK